MKKTVKNITVYVLTGIILSYVYAVYTVYLIKPREEIILNFPENWQILWLLLLNCVGVFSYFAARKTCPLVFGIKNKKIFEFVFTAYALIFVLIITILSGRYTVGFHTGFFGTLHEKYGIIFISGFDIILFFIIMFVVYQFLYAVREYRFLSEKEEKE